MSTKLGAIQTRDFLAEMYESGVIKACEDDIPTDAESLIRAGKLERFVWALNVVDEQGRRMPRANLSALILRKLTNEFRPYWEEEIFELAQSLAFDEVEAFLEYHLRDGGVTFRAYNRLRVSLAILVREFPLNAIYPIIWQACASAKQAVRDNKVKSSVHAGNLIPGKVDDLAKRRRAAEATPCAGRGYNRNSVVVEGTVTEYLSAFLGVGDVLFTYGLDRLRDELLRPRLALDALYGSGQKPVSASDVAKKIMVALGGGVTES